MPTYRRPQITGATVFFTVNLADRQATLLIDHIGHLRSAVRKTQAERPFESEAWVVLPNHLHCIWRLPAGDSDFSTRWRLIKSRFSHALPAGPRRASHIKRGEKGIWQRRFWEHHIRDSTDFAHHLRYCWYNPVKHGYVTRPEDWVHSSVHYDARYRAGEGCYLMGNGA